MSMYDFKEQLVCQKIKWDIFSAYIFFFERICH